MSARLSHRHSGGPWAGLAVAAAFSACGSGATTPATMTMTTHVDPTWTDMTLTSAVEIAAGTVVTIAPGAHLTVGAKVPITVRGTLKVASAAEAHARITAADANGQWTGIIVENGGTLAADGLDLDGAETAVDVRAGAAAARYDHGTITNALYAFTVARAGRLDSAHAKVVQPRSTSAISGELHASYLDYDKAAINGGFVVSDALAIFDVTDSTLHGTPGAQGADYITTLGASLLHVAYTTITDSHCAFHFDGLDRFEIDHVTTGASTPTGVADKNSWGAMLYGSGAGPSVIKDSNFLNASQNLDEQGDNGPITITNTYTTSKNVNEAGVWTLSASESAAAIIPDAMPR
ncbi:MAG: hypothetical protein JWM82_1490 [Myxococcales bacterium]|nr:hypothetical protein [Myxococcales bacterium]